MPNQEYNGVNTGTYTIWSRRWESIDQIVYAQFCILDLWTIVYHVFKLKKRLRVLMFLYKPTHTSWVGEASQLPTNQSFWESCKTLELTNRFIHSFSFNASQLYNKSLALTRFFINIIGFWLPIIQSIACWYCHICIHSFIYPFLCSFIHSFIQIVAAIHSFILISFLLSYYFYCKFREG